jgi:hypothetical protein
MQHDIIKQKIKHVLDKKLTSTKTKQYISKSYMQIKRALPPGPRPASICSIHGTVKTLSDLLHLHCGTASQIISGLKIASLNSRVSCSPGMGPNVAANKKSKNSSRRQSMNM